MIEDYRRAWRVIWWLTWIVEAMRAFRSANSTGLKNSTAAISSIIGRAIGALAISVPGYIYVRGRNAAIIVVMLG